MLSPTFTPGFLKQLELLKLRSRRAFLGSKQGGHLSIKRGHGIEFSDYRKYELGDHPRYIDWGVYARSEKLYIKRFQEEQDISVLIILDSSASMNTPADDGKWQRARDITAALAYVALMEQDSVNVAALGKFYSPAYYGTRAIHHLGKELNSLSVTAQVDTARELQLALSRIRFPGVAVFISDFLMPYEVIEKSFNMLRAKNLDITAIQVLGPSDIDPFISGDDAVAVDSETGEEIDLSFAPEAQDEYRNLLAGHNQRIRSFLSENRISYAMAVSTQNISDFMINNLAKTGLLR